ncbi:PQQ-binding-like beta-propeller repeat protein [candidate division WWE3 bacterium]|uniref:PQQ-binding-like beta-propeller repeat protein n=1 Tax=candidate division WWE3 bacterium TaxID=2053526 RepID=A0A955LH13_UNCKA|nr:PQQ-binding-like beta-propeller repeat protein [candidate division WWE3 bacterium]
MNRYLKIALLTVFFFVASTTFVYADGLDYLEIDPGTPQATLPLDRVINHQFDVTNTSDQYQEIFFSIYVVDTEQEIVGWPQPQVLYLDPGETKTVQTFLDENWGRLDKESSGDQSRTVEWRFENQSSGETRTETVTYQVDVLDTDSISGDLILTGTLIDHDNMPVGDVPVVLTTGNWSTTVTSAADGSFTFPGVPTRDDWMIYARQTSETSGQMTEPQDQTDCDPPPAPCNQPPVTEGQEQTSGWFVTDAYAHETVGEGGFGFVYVDPEKTNYVIELQAPEDKAQYSIDQTVKTDIGFWKGDTDALGKYILLINGMENWSGQDKTASKLYLYSIDGKLIWTYEMGYEGWGADLSEDGTYAAFTTSNPTHSFGVIDVATGNPVWTKNSSDYADGLRMPSSEGGIDSKEVTISPDNKYLAVGHGGGAIVVFDLLTGDFVWKTDLKGQVRRIIFDEESKYIYAGSGDGNAYKLSIDDGSVVWKADIGAWPFVDAFTLSKDGSYLASGSKLGHVTVIQTETGDQLWQYHQKGTASWVAFSPDGEYLFAGGGGQYASTLYDAKTGQRLWSLNRYSHQGTFSADGKYIYVGDSDVVVVDLNGNILDTITSPTASEGTSNGQFTYVSADGGTVVFTKRDLKANSVSLIFAKGSIVGYGEEFDQPVDQLDGRANALKLPSIQTLRLIGAGFIGVIFLILVLIVIKITRRKMRKSPAEDIEVTGPFSEEVKKELEEQYQKETQKKSKKKSSKQSPD